MSGAPHSSHLSTIPALTRERSKRTRRVVPDERQGEQEGHLAASAFLRRLRSYSPGVPWRWSRAVAIAARPSATQAPKMHSPEAKTAAALSMSLPCDDIPANCNAAKNARTPATYAPVAGVGFMVVTLNRTYGETAVLTAS